MTPFLIDAACAINLRIVDARDLLMAVVTALCHGATLVALMLSLTHWPTCSFIGTDRGALLLPPICFSYVHFNFPSEFNERDPLNRI